MDANTTKYPQGNCWMPFKLTKMYVFINKGVRILNRYFTLVFCNTCFLLVVKNYYRFFTSKEYTIFWSFDAYQIYHVWIEKIKKSQLTELYCMITKYLFHLPASIPCNKACPNYATYVRIRLTSKYCLPISYLFLYEGDCLLQYFAIDSIILS